MSKSITGITVPASVSTLSFLAIAQFVSEKWGAYKKSASFMGLIKSSTVLGSIRGSAFLLALITICLSELYESYKFFNEKPKVVNQNKFKS